jgi:hypothetical protein
MGNDRQDQEEKVRIRDTLESLPVFSEDLFLRRQAMNIDLVDAYLSEWETALLAQCMEEEGFPSESAVTVSAFSQMWIFGLYELLRTWRQRAKEICKFAQELGLLDEPARITLISEKKQQVTEAAALAGSEAHYWRPYEKAIEDDNYVERIRKAVDQSERLFRRIESLRMPLAKHEVPKEKGSFAWAPNCGGIDKSNGSIYWHVELRENEADVISRRSLADECRGLIKDRSHVILPVNIQEKMKDFPKHSYALKKVTVVLKDGTEQKNVLVAWSREIFGVLGQDKIPFDANDVVDVRYEAN